MTPKDLALLQAKLMGGQMPNPAPTMPEEDRTVSSQAAAEAPAEEESPQGSVEQPAVGVQQMAPTLHNPPKKFSELSREDFQRSPEQQALAKALQEKITGSMDQQQQMIDMNKMRAAGLANMDVQPNLSGLMGIANSLSRNGSNYGTGYAAPQSASERRAEVSKALEGVQSGQQALTKDQISNLKDQLSKNDAANALKLAIAQQASADKNTSQGNRMTIADMMTQMKNNQQSLQTDRMDRTDHRQVVSALNNNKPLAERASQYQNLQNAMSIVANAKNLTPQQIHEFQQSIRSNLGIKGSSGINERDKTQLDSLGLRADAFEQFLTGDPAKISQDNEMVKHIKDLANIEMGNIKNQYGDTMDAISSGHESLYDRRPDLKSDLESKIKNMGKRMNPDKVPSSQSAPQQKQETPEEARAKLKAAGVPGY